MFEITGSESNQETEKHGAVIKVIGVGGGGCNAVNTMIKEGLRGVDYIVANTDAQALRVNMAETKIQLGVDITKGLGAGANPEVGRKAALDEYEKLSEVLEDADMIFITAGMGGGTGTGAAPVIAKLAKELGALTVGVVTKPFLFEGRKRMKQAKIGLSELEESVDSLITIPNQRLLQIAGENLSLIDTFKKADEVLLNAVRGISDLINNTGHINADFADVCTVMSNKGLALMGTGIASGPDRAITAATEAISSPLLEDITIDGATGIIINITGNSSLTMHETNDAVTLVMEAADEDAEIIFGTVIDDNMNDEIKVTVIATGLNQESQLTSNLNITNQNLSKVSSNNILEQQTQLHTQEQIAIQERQNFINSSSLNTKAEITQNNINANAGAASTSFDNINNTQGTRETSQNINTNTISNISQNNLDDNNMSSVINKEFNNKRVDEALSLRQKLENIRKPMSSSINPNMRDQSTISSNGLYGNSINNPEIKNAQDVETKPKSIAERLGFFNFDEDELDTPTYLRKKQSLENQTN